MTRRQLSVLTVAMSAALAIPLVALAQAEKVTICHVAGQLGSEQYVEITAAYNAVYGQAGHFNEDGTPNAGHEQDIEGPCPTVETTTTTAAPTTTTTQATTTTVDGTTTTTDDPPSSTTTEPPPETTSTSTTPTTAPTTTSAGPSTSITETTLVQPPPPIEQPDALPFTGLPTSLLTGVGVVLLSAGGMLIRKLGVK